MDHAVVFIVGLVTGGALGVLAMAICCVAGRDDELTGRK